MRQQRKALVDTILANCGPFHRLRCISQRKLIVLRGRTGISSVCIGINVALTLSMRPVIVCPFTRSVLQSVGKLTSTKEPTIAQRKRVSKVVLPCQWLNLTLDGRRYSSIQHFCLSLKTACMRIGLLASPTIQLFFEQPTCRHVIVANLAFVDRKLSPASRARGTART